MRTFVNRRGLAAAVAIFFAASPLFAATSEYPQNLGFGLDKLVESRAIIKANPARAIYSGYATEQAASYASMAITEADSERVLVDIVATGKVGFDALRANLQATLPSLTIKSVDSKYRGVGVIEAFISVDDATALAKTPGVKAAFLALKPYTRANHGPVQNPSVVAGDHLNKIGTAFDQGVIQHRVDRINQLYNPAAPVNYDGTGMSIGILSDSYDTRATAPHAATAVTNFDLPGGAANPWNTTPVVVLQDDPGGTDEGRGMVEIAYKMAPKAHLAFATANTGEVGFANNIRALAALPGFAYPANVQQGFKADVIADDVGYFDEPWYEDGIIGEGIDDVAAAGVSYFSSAANDIGMNGYESELRIVPNGTGFTAATNSALLGTNIDLSAVPANLYAGGFHNFNPSPGQRDVAQLTNVSGTQVLTIQWDDPYDSRELVLDEPPIFSSGGTIDNTTTSVTFGPASTPALPVFTAGQAYVITEAATSGNFDAIINIFDSSSNLVLSQDTGADETVNFYPIVTDQYHITVNRFSTTTGTFSLTVNTAPGVSGVTTDLNLLVFSSAGAYVASQSLTTNNVVTNRPIDLAQFPFGASKQVQFVISRGNSPTLPANQLPTHVRWLIPGNGAGNIGPAEYFKYNTVTTGGHATAAGCNGTAAYSVFKANIPESFTSPGPATLYFDKQSNRLPVPEVRQQPRIAAADGANTSFFTSDSSGDLDTNPNFSGTSAAAPHAAAIAALVLQAHGGSGSLSPAQMTQILQNSTFPHDLDPAYASGTAFTSSGANVTVTINSDNETQFQTGANDTSSFQIFYSGPGSLASITFNPAGTASTGGNVTGGNNGPMNDAASSPATITYFENNFPGMAFMPTTRAFALGPLTGLTTADVTSPLSATPFTGFSNLTAAPGNGTSQFNTMTIGFPNSNFVAGNVVRFTVGRGVGHSATTGNGATIGPGTVSAQYNADLFGGGVLLPSGIVVTDGMTFSGTTTGGGTFSGVIRNNIGKGYSVLDGYGFIDASLAAGSLHATGAAGPNSGYPGDAVLLTSTVTPGTSPASTNLAVNANLSAIGGSSSQQLYDDGTHGDQTPGDNVFSFATVVGLSATAGPKAMAVAVSDGQARTGNAQINFTVLAPTSPTGVGAANPATLSQTQNTLLTVATAPGAGPASTGIAVKVDLSSIGGSPTQAMYDDGSHGDLTASDGTYSFSAPVLLGATPGPKNLTATISDAQARSSTTGIALTVLTPTALSGVAAANPASMQVTVPSLFTVNTTAGTNPPSTGISVVADLQLVGGSATQQFYDDGSHGDVTAGDGIFSFAVTAPVSTTPGSKRMDLSLADAQGRSFSTQLLVSVLPSTAPQGFGSATPSAGAFGASTLLTVVVTPGIGPASTGTVVQGELSSIGGSFAQQFYDDGTHGDQTAGDGTFSFALNVGAAAPGAKDVSILIVDDQGRFGSAHIAFNYLAPGALSAVGVATPTVVSDLGGNATLIVAVTPGSNPVSSGVTVTVDLSSIGGSATQSFYDDGTHGDQTAGDNIFTFTAAVPPSVPAVKSFAASIVDAQSRTGSATIQLTISDVIFQNGFE
jgi:hypothetical protein